MKSKPIKSKKLRASARGEDCTLRLACCNGNPETVVMAHIGLNGGMGSKCGDNMAVFACSACHELIDSASKSAYAADKLRALEETQQVWIDNGLMSYE